MKVSALYGKQVESTDGKRGYVISVNAEDGRLSCLVCADEDENEFAVSAKNIKKVRDTIIFRSDENFKKYGEPVRLGRAVYNENGIFIGLITDFSVSGGKLTTARIGNKNYAAEELIFGDVILHIKNGRRSLKYDVKKDGKTLIKKGTPLTSEILEAAAKNGEYVQTNLRSF